MEHAGSPAREQYEAALEAKLGKPKPARREHFIYGKQPVDVKYSKHTYKIEVSH